MLVKQAAELIKTAIASGGDMVTGLFKKQKKSLTLFGSILDLVLI